MNSNGVDLSWWEPGTIPAPMSIVWCAFPDHVNPERPGPKERPALVLKVRYADDPPQDRFVVRVVYGTSRLKSAERPFDFAIANYGMRRLCRLPQGTRFDLDQVVWLPWAKPYFIAREGDSTPVVSVLPRAAQMDFAWLMHAREEMGMNGELNADC
jgi:hypothetical protein